MSNLNRNYEERDRLLFGRVIQWDQEELSVKRFRDLGIDRLKELVAKNYADPDDSQNGSPTGDEFCKFLEKYPHVKAHGYAVSPQREDYRVTIEGLEYTGAVSEELGQEFKKMNSHADDFTCTDQRLFCWYD